MRSDAILFAAIFIFIFILWVYTGGPTHPISFAGPYLTPVTNVGGESQAYGPKTGSLGGAVSKTTFWGNWSAGWGTSNSNSTNTSAPDPSRSPSTGKIYIDGGSSHLGNGGASQEYVTLRASSNISSPISITGWQLVSKNSGTHTVIRQGTPIVRQSTAGPITLKANDQAIISTGASSEGASFKETKCTGYLNQRDNSYYPQLSEYTCPSPINDLDSYQSGSPVQYNQCADYVRGLQGCRTGDVTSVNLASWCESFITNQLTYNGCVRAHQDDTNFYSNTWRVFQGSGTPLWRSRGDTITLLDQNLLVVDQYSY
ncbi:hypothetical protein BH11PAT2_BH11PAT2_08910 [soil metagenome]